MLNEDLLEARQGLLLCLVGPTGSGKSTVGRELLKRESGKLQLSISVTSRKPRDGETDGIHYHFVSGEEFEQWIDDGVFFEWEKVHDHYYGTLNKTVQSVIGGDFDLLLDIDIRGALNFKKSHPLNTVIIFMLAPSVETLLERIDLRSKLEKSDINKRLETAREECGSLLESHNNRDGLIDYLVVNDSLDQTIGVIHGILNSERQRLLRCSEDVLMKLCSLKTEDRHE